MNKSILTIDGSYGEGGGQVLRSSLAMSLVTGRPFVIENIRAGRKKPGLMRQHLTAVNAAVEVSHAEAAGAAIDSARLEFRPGQVTAGKYKFSVGTAGSATLVLQTVLPALLLADGESHLTLEGGTHNPFAPPLDFLTKAYLPLVNRMGPKVTVDPFYRPGFYPAGGGKFTVHVQPVRNSGDWISSIAARFAPGGSRRWLPIFRSTSASENAASSPKRPAGARAVSSSKWCRIRAGRAMLFSSNWNRRP